MASGGSASNTLADFDKQSDITGIDVSTGVMDEDNSFVGQMQAGKVEIKKEVTLSLTRKKNNNCWDVIFNGPINSGYMEITSQKGGARWGHADNSSALAAGLINPKDVRDMLSTSGKVGYGYRVALVLKSGTATDGTTETMTIPNCALNSYSVTLGADAVDEETLEFVTNQSPRFSIGTEYNYTLTDKTAF